MNIGLDIIEAIEGFTGVPFPIFLVIVITVSYFIIIYKGRDWGILPNMEAPQPIINPQITSTISKIEKTLNLYTSQIDSIRTELTKLNRRTSSAKNHAYEAEIFDVVGFGYRGSKKVARIEVMTESGEVSVLEWECYADGTLKELDKLREKARLLMIPLSDEPQAIEPEEETEITTIEEPEQIEEVDEAEEIEDKPVEAVASPEEENDQVLQLLEVMRTSDIPRRDSR